MRALWRKFQELRVSEVEGIAPVYLNGGPSKMVY